MNTPAEHGGLNEMIQERFKQLPKAVQKAITSADVEKHLRVLSDSRKLHVDQWQLLENNVMLTLLGFQPFDELAAHLKSDLNISQERAGEIATDISKNVFEPIRQELERELGHPAAQAKDVSGVDTAREQTLANQRTEKDTGGNKEQTGMNKTPAVPARSPEPTEQKLEAPADTSTPQQQPTPSSGEQTPPPSPKPAPKAVRMPSSGAYKPGEASTARKDIHDDPYREQPA